MRTVAEPSVGTVLEEGARVLAASQIPNPRRQAAEIWTGLFKKDLASVWVAGEQPPAPEETARFRAAIDCRAAGEPIQYVLGRAGFRTLDLEVDLRVLIPRPETEGVVELVLQWCAAHSGVRWGTVVDVGTGSGCIAISFAVEGRFDRIIATDVSREALAVAARNARPVRNETPIEFRVGSLLQPLGDEPVHVLVSNPPYLTPNEFQRADRSVAAYEPELALVGGPDGLDHVRALLVGAGDHMANPGLIALEVDSTRADLALAIARHTGWTDARIEEDLFGRPRYLLATKGVVT